MHACTFWFCDLPRTRDLPLIQWKENIQSIIMNTKKQTWITFPPPACGFPLRYRLRNWKSSCYTIGWFGRQQYQKRLSLSFRIHWRWLNNISSWITFTFATTQSIYIVSSIVLNQHHIKHRCIKNDSWISD